MNPDEPNFTTPPEDFEIVEIDVTPYLTEEQKSWPVCDLYQNEDFAIEEPLPILDMIPAENDLNEKEEGYPALIAAVYAFEKSLGGEGFTRVYPPQLNGANGHKSVALVPTKAEGARERLEQVARWVVEVGKLATRANVT